MIATNSGRLCRLTLPLLLGLACAACAQKDADRPAPPETAAPAPAPAVTTAEDRGQKQPDAQAKPADDQDAFSHVDAGDSERAASQRGHESAGEQTPATQPGSGG